MGKHNCEDIPSGVICQQFNLNCPAGFVTGGVIESGRRHVRSITEFDCNTVAVNFPRQGSEGKPHQLPPCSDGYNKLEFWRDDDGVSGLRFHCVNQTHENGVYGHCLDDYSETLVCENGEVIKGVEGSYYNTPNKSYGAWWDISNIHCGPPEIPVCMVKEGKNMGWSGSDVAFFIIAIIALVIVLIIGGAMGFTI